MFLSVVGRKWLKGFLRRHPEITFRTPEAVTSASAKVSEGDIRRYFADLGSYLEHNNLMTAALDPRRMFNGDETSFFLHPLTKAVLALRGSRNVYEVEHADSHKNITVMFSFGANGSVVPPGVVLPMQRLSAEVLRNFPGDWGIGKSPKGWMDTTNFMLYIRNVFYPHLLKNKVELPVLYFVDGHSSHTAAEVAELCLDLGIVLIALYPNTTRITQPADVAIFGPLKKAWADAVLEWRMNNTGEILSLKDFPGVLQKAINEGIKKDSIKNGFKVCGLFPFGADNVDYEKCIAKSVREDVHNPVVSDGKAEKDLVASDAVENSQDIARTECEDEASPIVSDAYETVHKESVESVVGKHGLNGYIERQDVLENSILIPTLTIQAAIDCIGRERIAEFNDGIGRSEEGVIIQQLYKILLMPFDSQNREANDMIQEVVITEDSNPGEESEFFDEMGTDFPGLEERNTRPLSALKERNGDHISSRKMSISELLQTPPTPRRSSSHRNYKRKFYPVLTASERLEEIRQLEEEKENEVARKKTKVEERELAKIRAEELKIEKAEIRKKKQEKVEQRKMEREKLRKQKQEEVEQRKKEKRTKSRASRRNITDRNRKIWSYLKH